LPPIKNKVMSPFEWLLLILLSLMWGSSFVFNAVVLAELQPLTVVLGRTVLGAIALNLLVRMSGHRMPADPRRWADFAFMGVIGILIPFNLILWGQIQIDSGLASILIAMTPLFTVALAHVLTRDERLTANRAGGVILGLVGVSFMIGPDVLLGLGLQVAAQLACLGAALCYASTSIFGRRFKGMPPMVSATGQVTATAVMLAPIALVVDRPWTLPMPAIETWAALASLALLSTTAAYIIYFRILSTAGATNITLVTFLSPVSTILLAIAILGESPELRHFAGMGMIALGLAAMDGRPLALLKARVRGTVPAPMRPEKRGRGV
jgi:drug/metabolite transporter (DMT)-like permease